MTTQNNIACVRKAYDAFKRGDIKELLTYMAEDIDWTVLGPKDVIPFLGQYKGRTHVAKFFESLAANEEVLTFEPREFVAEGDSVAVTLLYRARVKSSGRTYEAEEMHLFHFRDGKIISFKDYGDTARMAMAYKAA